MSYHNKASSSSTIKSTQAPMQVHTITTGATTAVMPRSILVPPQVASSGYASSGAGLTTGPFTPIVNPSDTEYLNSTINELKRKLVDAQRGILTDDTSEELETAYSAMKDLIEARAEAVEIIRQAVEVIDCNKPVHGEMLEYLSKYDDYNEAVPLEVDSDQRLIDDLLKKASDE